MANCPKGSLDGVCGLCEAAGRRQTYAILLEPAHESYQRVHSCVKLPCGHIIDAAEYEEGGPLYVLYFDEVHYDFYLESFLGMRHVQHASSGGLDRFLAGVKGARNLKSVMQGRYDGEGLSSLLDLFDQMIPAYYAGVRSMIRARLMLLLLATIPLTDANKRAIYERMRRRHADISEWESVLTALSIRDFIRV